MSETGVSQGVLPSAGAVGNDLAWDACQAAAELDSLIQGKTIKLEAVGRLASTLAASFSGVPGAAPQSLMIDPTTTVVLADALRESTPRQKVASINQLKDLTEDLVAQLQSVQTTRVGEKNCSESSAHFVSLSHGMLSVRLRLGETNRSILSGDKRLMIVGSGPPCFHTGASSVVYL